MAELTCMELELKKGIPNFIRLCEESFKKDATDKNVGSKTNADRIRAMSDEELAEFLSYGCACPTENCRPSCVHCIGNWLQQPAEVE